MVSPEAAGIEPAAPDALLARATREVDEGHLPSAQIALARHGQLIAFRTFGAVTHEGVAAPATNETRYCVFSCTKAITLAIAWLLIQEGTLRIDERVADVVPEFGANGKEQVPRCASGVARRSLRPRNQSGADGSRTHDLLNAIQALSQLSYGPGRAGRVRAPRSYTGAVPVGQRAVRRRRARGMGGGRPDGRRRAPRSAGASRWRGR